MLRRLSEDGRGGGSRLAALIDSVKKKKFVENKRLGIRPGQILQRRFWRDSVTLGSFPRCCG